METVEFDRLYEQFRSLEADVIGVSADGPDTMERFGREKGPNVNLVADPDARIISLFDVRKPDSNKAERSTYLITPDGTIAKAYRKVRAGGHAQKVLEDLQDLREQ